MPGWKIDHSGVAKTHEDMADHLEKVLKSAESRAIGIVPVDTGALRGTIGHEVDRQALVGQLYAGNAEVDYADNVELGTSRSPAQPFLRPAIVQAIGE